MKKYSIIVTFVIIGGALFAIGILVSWWVPISIVLVILGALGHVERIFNIKWSRKWSILFLSLFILFSAGNIIKSKTSEDVATKAKGQIAGLTKDKDELREEVKQAKDDVTIAKGQVEKERIARMELEKQLAPRNLSESDRASIINAMSKFRGMTIKVQRRGELEPYNFANQIAEALQSAGLRVQVEGGIGGIEGPEYGVIWWAHKERPDIGNALSKLLTDLQIPNRGYFIKDLETDAALRVGLKILKVK